MLVFLYVVHHKFVEITCAEVQKRLAINENVLYTDTNVDRGCEAEDDTLAGRHRLYRRQPSPNCLVRHGHAVGLQSIVAGLSTKVVALSRLI